MNAPLARYLTRFASADTDPDAVAAAALDIGSAEPTITLGVAELETRLADAGRSAQDAAHEAFAQERGVLAEARETAVAEALAAARADWCATAADEVAALVERAFRTLHEGLGAEIARVLRPLLSDAMRERTLALLGAAIDRLLADPSHPAITLKGPADLVAALRARHALEGVDLVEADTTETTITAAGARVETRLTKALADLAAVEV